MSTTDPLYVVARNYRQFLDWCQRKGHDPNSRAFRYVRDVKVLMGPRHSVRIIFVGNWRDRVDAVAIYNRALVIGRRPQ